MTYISAVLCLLGLTTVTAFHISLTACPKQCLCGLNATDCKNNKFSEIPKGLDPNVTVLDLAFNDFKVVPQQFNKYKNLVHLNLSHNQIRSLDSEAFFNLRLLSSVDLTYNYFDDCRQIPFRTFDTASNLTFLDFSHNRLGCLMYNNTPLHNNFLRILRLNNCSIEYLSNKILERLPNLQELHLTNNPIKYLDVNLVSSSLRFIDFSDCDLQQFKSSIVFTNISSLEAILMKRNLNLKKFDCDSPSLRFLDVSDCNLEVIPSGSLPNVYKANFRGNHFRNIPANSFITFDKLEELDLSLNSISVIAPHAFSGLKVIETINLSENTISNIEVNLFESNEVLQFLYLSKNYIKGIPQFVSDSLKVLDLSSCEITSIDSASLTYLPLLQLLNLSKNRISKIPDQWTASNLETLDLSLCRIKNINNHTFSSMDSLRTLNLAGNSLTFASPESFSQVTNLDITDNPWMCDCLNLKPLYDWLCKTGKRVDGLYCESPKLYEGLSWLDACDQELTPEINHQDSIWLYTTGLLVTVFIFLFLIVITRRMYIRKEKRLREAESRRRTEEQARLYRMQRSQADAREEATRNAPDPRELQTPPSYNEALLLPKLDASHPSLSGSLHSLASKHSLHGSLPDVSRKNKPRRRRRRRRSDSSESQSQRASRVIVDSDTTSDSERPPPRPALESDF